MATHHRHHGHHHHGRSARRLKPIHYVLIVLGLALLLFGIDKGFGWLEARVHGDPPDQSEELPAAAEKAAATLADADDGDRQDAPNAYEKRSHITTILLMGVDNPDSESDASGTRSGGQADFIRLMVIDHDREKITQVQIDRDTMTPIVILGVLGNRSSVRTAQICMSHSYGDGKQESCKLTVEAVENLLFNRAKVDFYMALNMDGISDLNDAVGGVTVTLEDDFSGLDPAMKQGETITLQGDQAEYFVRGRRSVGVGTNEARMARQQQYISLLTDLVDERIRRSKGFIGELYDDVSPYLISNISRGRLINEAWQARNYDRSFVTIQGRRSVGENGYMEFYVDDASLEQQVLDLFYEPVK